MKQLSELCVKTASGVGEAHREAFAEVCTNSLHCELVIDSGVTQIVSKAW